jgi:hypothetical protein
MTKLSKRVITPKSGREDADIKAHAEGNNDSKG